jgi:hypothetical protein
MPTENYVKQTERMNQSNCFKYEDIEIDESTEVHVWTRVPGHINKTDCSNYLMHVLYT